MFLVLPSTYAQWHPWRERIRHFTWAWYSVVMGTGVISALLHGFPYQHGAVKILALVFLFLTLVIFTFVSVCTILRYVLYPKLWRAMLSNPGESLFFGCVPIGVMTILNGALAVNQDWGTGGQGFLYTLWGFWWLDAGVSCLTAFFLIHAMITRYEYSVSRMSAAWLLPILPPIVASSSGGFFARALQPHSHTLALVSTCLSLVMVIASLSFYAMIMTIYLLRLITHGLPEPSVILSAVVTFGPLGQGGFSLLLNGQQISELLPLHIGLDFPQSQLSGQMIFAVCFCGAFVLFSIGVAWIILTCMNVGYIASKHKIPFSLAYWGIIFPTGVYGLLCQGLARTLDSPFFRVVATIWTGVVFIIFIVVFAGSIPSFIDGALFIPNTSANVMVHPPTPTPTTADTEAQEYSLSRTPTANNGNDIPGAPGGRSFKAQ